MITTATMALSSRLATCLPRTAPSHLNLPLCLTTTNKRQGQPHFPFNILPSSSLSWRHFSLTPAIHAPPNVAHGNKSRAKRLMADRDPKIKILDKAMYKLKFVPPPLRMGRNRYLRHWTIHRAWLLFRRQNREHRERELMQQYQSMQNACEELRNTAGPGHRDLGYLYRVAMEKKGIWGHDGIPIEYARPQTDTPAREPWNHGWKR